MSAKIEVLNHEHTIVLDLTTESLEDMSGLESIVMTREEFAELVELTLEYWPDVELPAYFKELDEIMETVLFSPERWLDKVHIDISYSKKTYTTNTVFVRAFIYLHDFIIGAVKELSTDPQLPYRRGDESAATA